MFINISATWKLIVCIVPFAKLPKEEIDALHLQLPTCHVGFTWEGRTAPNAKLLNQAVHLLGAKPPHANFTIRCPDVKADDEGTLQCTGTHTIS